MINFLRYRVVTAITSFMIIAAFFGYALYRKQTTGETFRYGIEFTGGAQVLLKFDKPVSALAVKAILAKHGWESAALREFGTNEILVRIKLEAVAKELGVVAERMQEVLHAEMPDNNVVILQSTSVGPESGEALRGKSIRSIIFVLLAILIYLALRFWSLSFSAGMAFALGAVVALIHDALLMLAAFLFLHREISMDVVFAILAMLGYSMNDTIVIFSRIKENLRKMSHDSLKVIVNTSINQTLRRTLLTSTATGLPICAMLIFGGDTLKDLTLALLVGIIVGTYSSIYVASPVMMLLYRGKRA